LVPFALRVAPVQSTVALLTGDAGVHTASARPLIANDASSSADIMVCRRRISFGPATGVLARRPDFSPTLATANAFKTSLRPIRFKFGRIHAGKLRVRASTGRLSRCRLAAPRGS